MSIPRVLSGRYEIGELLGRGGMADVYMARDLRLGRVVAVKLLRGDLARDSQLQARFKREAQAVAGLNHPSIVSVYDTGEHATEEPLRDGAILPYIVMEYVQGRTLRDLVRSHEVSVDNAIDYTLGVLSALEYSHRAGIVHRDIKPANVMVTQDVDDRRGTVKVMDFGIARTIADSAATMTQTQTVIGTAQYLSPEQARGETVDERSDLYSAACLFYEMLAGRPPFIGDSPVSVAYQHVREMPIPASRFNPEITPALDSVLLRALQKGRGDRFQDAASFRRALRAARTGVQLAPLPASEAPTDPDGEVPPIPARPAPDVRASPLPVAHSVADTQSEGPHTRAVAKVMAGGALTRNDAGPRDMPEGPDVATKRRRRAWITTLFVFLAFILVGGGILGYNLITAEPSVPPTVEIPSFAHATEDEALTQLMGMGLIPTPDLVFDATVPEGEVINTDPTAGTSVNEHSSISVIVSKGPSTVTIPKDLASKTEAEARSDIAALGLKAGQTIFVDNPTIANGLVVTTDPALGELVPVGTTVNIMLSDGQVVMPPLYNQTKKEVEETVKKASPTLKVEFVEVENAVVTPGTVTGQSVAAGSKVDQNTTITVQLAKAPPEATTTPSESATPPPTAGPDEQ